MDNSHNTEQPGRGSTPVDEDTLAALLRLAGPRTPVPAERHERVRLAVHDQWQENLRSRRRRLRTLWAGGALAAAAALVLVVGLGLRREAASSATGLDGRIRIELVKGAVHSSMSGELKPGDELEVGEELQTAAGSRAAIRLPGGASLRLDSATRAQLFSSSAILLYQGAAYVDTGSAAGAAPRIEIRTPLGRVTEIGTQFEVRLDGDSMSLRVREGRVSLEQSGRTYRAEAGQQILSASGGSVETSEIPRHGEEWSWTLGVAPAFELEGRSLQEFLDWVASETGWRVEYSEASLEAHAPELILHGSVEGLRPDETPGVVLPTCGLNHRVVEGVLLVERSGGNR